MKNMKLITEAWKRFLNEAQRVAVWPDDKDTKGKYDLGVENFPVKGQVIKISPNTLKNPTEGAIIVLESKDRDFITVEVKTPERYTAPSLINRGKNRLIISGKIVSRTPNQVSSLFEITSQGINDWKIENLTKTESFGPLEKEYNKNQDVRDALGNISFEQIKKEFNPLMYGLETILEVLYEYFGDIAVIQGSKPVKIGEEVVESGKHYVKEEFKLYENRVTNLFLKLSQSGLTGGNKKYIKIGGMIDRPNQPAELEGPRPLEGIEDYKTLFERFPIQEEKLLFYKDGNGWGCQDAAVALSSIMKNRETSPAYATDTILNQKTAMGYIFGTDDRGKIADKLEALGLNNKSAIPGVNKVDTNFLMGLYYLTQQGLGEQRIQGCKELQGTLESLVGNLNMLRANPKGVERGDIAVTRAAERGRGYVRP